MWGPCRLGGGGSSARALLPRVVQRDQQRLPWDLMFGIRTLVPREVNGPQPRSPPEAPGTPQRPPEGEGRMHGQRHPRGQAGQSRAGWDPARVVCGAFGLLSPRPLLCPEGNPNRAPTAGGASALVAPQPPWSEQALPARLSCCFLPLGECCRGPRPSAPASLGRPVAIPAPLSPPTHTHPDCLVPRAGRSTAGLRGSLGLAASLSGTRCGGECPWVGDTRASLQTLTCPVPTPAQGGEGGHWQRQRGSWGPGAWSCPPNSGTSQWASRVGAAAQGAHGLTLIPRHPRTPHREPLKEVG